MMQVYVHEQSAKLYYKASKASMRVRLACCMLQAAGRKVPSERLWRAWEVSQPARGSHAAIRRYLIMCLLCC